MNNRKKIRWRKKLLIPFSLSFKTKEATDCSVAFSSNKGQLLAATGIDAVIYDYEGYYKKSEAKTGELIIGAVGGKISGAIAKGVTKGIAKYVEFVVEKGLSKATKFSSNFESHMTTVEDFTQKKGVVGGHNEIAFFNYFKDNNIPIKM